MTGIDAVLELSNKGLNFPCREGVRVYNGLIMLVSILKCECKVYLLFCSLSGEERSVTVITTPFNTLLGNTLGDAV